MPLAAEEWSRVRQIFEAALALPSSERSGYLAQACGSDGAVRREVDALLASSEHAEGLAVVSADDETISRDSLEGHQLGPYRITTWIGAGGMGEVYKARDVRLERTVAIKVVRSYARADLQARERFDREARAVAGLNHPNICTLHDIGHESGVDFLVIEHLQGETLATRLGRGAVPIREALAIACQVASALQHAHGAGVIHRDLKPGNIFLVQGDEEATPTSKLLDFGLAKTVPAMRVATEPARVTEPGLTTPGMILGSVQYMAPEQIDGRPADARTDIFAFGVVLFEMLTGRKAFEGDSQARIMSAILERDPPPLSEIAPHVPAALDRLIRTCVAKRPADRWQHASDLVRELRSIAPSDMQPRSSPARPRRRVSLPVLVGVAAITAVVAGLWRIQRPSGTIPAPPRPVFTQMTFTGHAAGGVISPRGDTFAYIDDSDSKRQRVHVQDLSGGASIAIHDADLIDDVRWLPSGNELQIVSRSGDAGFVTQVVPRFGGSARVVGRGPMAWAPDSRQVVTGWNAAAGEVRLGVSDVASLATINDRAPAIREFRNMWLRGLEWAPGPRPLIFTIQKDLSMRAVWALPETGPPRKLFEAQRLAEATWAPAGSALYVLVGDGSAATLSRLNLDSRGEPQLPPTDVLQGFNGDGIDVSADGLRLMFTRRTERAAVHLQALDERKDKNDVPVPTGTAADRTPKYSPDGRTIAFIREAGSGKRNVFLMDGGGPARQVTFLDGEVLDLAFSRDGRTLAFTFRPRAGPTKVGTVPIDGGQESWFEGATGAHIAWAPGDQIFVQGPGNRNIDVINPSTGARRPLMNNPKGFLFWPVVSSDRRRLAVNWNREKPGIWIVSVDNPSNEQFVIPDAMPLGFVAHDAYLLAWLPRRQQVARIRLETGAIESAISLAVEEPLTVVGDVSPDGRRFVFSQVQTLKDVWLVDNFDAGAARPK